MSRLPGDPTTEPPPPGKEFRNEKRGAGGFGGWGTIEILSILTKIEDGLPAIEDQEFSQQIKNNVAQTRKLFTSLDTKGIGTYSLKLDKTWNALIKNPQNKENKEALKSILQDMMKDSKKPS